MPPGSALILPGLVPISDSIVRTVLQVADHHLEIASEECRFDPASVPGQYPDGLSTTVHEALLAVAAIRRMEAEPEGWVAFGGLSAGCLTAVYAAGGLSERSCFRLINEINSRQIAAGAVRRSGTTLAVMTFSQADAEQLIELLRAEGHQPWLSVDLGAGAVAISVPAEDPAELLARLNRLGVLVLDSADRAEHCPGALPVESEFRALLDEVEFRVPTAVLVSPLTGRPVEPEPAALRSMLVEQWFDTASLPRLLAGLLAVPGVTGVDLITPARSVYINRVQKLLDHRVPHRALKVAG